MIETDGEDTGNYAYDYINQDDSGDRKRWNIPYGYSQGSPWEENNIDSFRFNASNPQKVHVCIWKHPKMTPYDNGETWPVNDKFSHINYANCFEPSTNMNAWDPKIIIDRNNITGIQLLKRCDHPDWKWDTDCQDNMGTCNVDVNNRNPFMNRVYNCGNDTNSASSRATGGSCYDENTGCFNNRKNECIGANLTTHTQCADWLKDTQTIPTITRLIDDKCSTLIRNRSNINNIEVCNNALSRICPSNSELLAFTPCQEYCGNNIDACTSAINTYCGTGNNMNTTACKNILNRIDAGGKFDTIVNNFCRNKPNDPFCACINPTKFNQQKAEIAAEITDPASKRTYLDGARIYCAYPPCYSGNAYKDVNKDMTCPDIKICAANISTENVTALQNSIINFSASCNMDGNNNTTDTEEKSSKKYIYIGGGVCISLLLLIAVIAIIFIL